MDRVDTKFLLQRSLIPLVLRELKAFCKVLKVGERRLSTYYNTYFDDSQLSFYHQHHRGKLNRHKIRYRKYGQHGQSFLEVKFKSNTNRTLKTRVELSPEQLNRHYLAPDFLREQGVNKVESLRATQYCNYTRIAMASEDTAERLTIDFDLQFQNLPSSQVISLPDLAIVELKQAKLARHSFLYQVLKSFQMRPDSFSKYCLGIALDSQQETKHNLFKRTLLRVEKLSGVSIHERNT
jgi:hypothetical protein